jgi:diaminohydroxyphosphoribosylaminopyrimidine deaminase / 5-amino-6-(5-phosphoribosylamino)uracil reductase
MKKHQNDIDWMNQALRLAEKGRGWASPNPLVGACLVKKNRLVASAFHAKFGGLHAEVEAIQKAGKRAKGATLYVTLEPCSTYGKTPPCTDTILSAGIKRVVVGAVDSNPRHNGKGIQILKKHAVSVTVGIVRTEAEEQNQTFFKWIRTGIPFVTLKMAQSLDGKIASRTGKSRWISGPEARQWVHELRASQDAVLVGKNTVLLDDPRLTVRNGKIRREPWRIVLDRKGEISKRAHLLRSHGSVILACSERFFKRAAQKFNQVSVTILPLKEHDGKLDLNELLKRLGALGITSLLVEGGGEAAWSFLNSKLVDKVAWVIAPKIIGGKDAKTSVEGLGVDSLKQAPGVQVERISALGQDFLIEGYVRF